jgi:hypothetical protein
MRHRGGEFFVAHERGVDGDRYALLVESNRWRLRALVHRTVGVGRSVMSVRGARSPRPGRRSRRKSTTWEPRADPAPALRGRRPAVGRMGRGSRRRTPSIGCARGTDRAVLDPEHAVRCGQVVAELEVEEGNRPAPPTPSPQRRRWTCRTACRGHGLPRQRGSRTGVETGKRARAGRHRGVHLPRLGTRRDDVDEQPSVRRTLATTVCPNPRMTPTPTFRRPWANVSGSLSHPGVPSTMGYRGRSRNKNADAHAA